MMSNYPNAGNAAGATPFGPRNAGPFVFPAKSFFDMLKNAATKPAEEMRPAETYKTEFTVRDMPRIAAQFKRHMDAGALEQLTLNKDDQMNSLVTWCECDDCETFVMYRYYAQAYKDANAAHEAKDERVKAAETDMSQFISNLFAELSGRPVKSAPKRCIVCGGDH